MAEVKSTDGEQVLLVFLLGEFLDLLKVAEVGEHNQARQQAEALYAKLTGEIDRLDGLFSEPSTKGWRVAVCEAFATGPRGITW